MLDATQNLAVTLFPSFENVNNFAEFIKAIYGFAVLIVAIAVFIQLLRAGWGLLISAGNSSKIGEARQMMTNAIAGAIILLSAVLILNIINPDLVNLQDPDLTDLNTPPRTTLLPSPTATPIAKTADVIDALKAKGIEPPISGNIIALQEYVIEDLGFIKSACEQNYSSGDCHIEILSMESLGGGSMGARLNVEVGDEIIDTIGDLKEQVGTLSWKDSSTEAEYEMGLRPRRIIYPAI
ncbi:MAG: hypothetical protein ABH833_01615 [Parcubacteria group bacterium]